MALRDQPYIPLYIQDFLTDEKLIECSAKSTGVYVRLMCIMHKSEDYGKILLKQKDKQSDKQIENFAYKITKQMPYSKEVVYDSLIELISEKVIFIDGDYLIQKRMVNDNILSVKRSKAGSKGGKFTQAKFKAKDQANTEYEIEIEIENEDEDVIENKNIVEKKDFKNQVIYPFDSEKFREKWEQWIQFRNDARKPYHTFSNIQAALQSLSKHNEETAIAIIQQSLSNNWINFHPLKNNHEQTRTSKPADFKPGGPGVL